MDPFRLLFREAAMGASSLLFGVFLGLLSAGDGDSGLGLPFRQQNQ